MSIDKICWILIRIRIETYADPKHWFFSLADNGWLEAEKIYPISIFYVSFFLPLPSSKLTPNFPFASTYPFFSVCIDCVPLRKIPWNVTRVPTCMDCQQGGKNLVRGRSYSITLIFNGGFWTISFRSTTRFQFLIGMTFSSFEQYHIWNMYSKYTS